MNQRPAGASSVRRRRRVLAVVATAAALLGLLAAPTLTSPAQAASGSPYGYSDFMRPVPGGLHFAGWAVDPDTPKPITVYVTVDGRSAGSTVANRPRPDVARAHPGAGPNHGYDTTLLLPEGQHLVCVWARNVGAGSDTALTCAQQRLQYSPIGAIQRVNAIDGAVSISGWTLDSDRPTAALTVTVTIDKTVRTVVAGQPNAAAGQAFAGAGANHGFSVSQPVAQGLHSICVRVTNIGYGHDSSLGCVSVNLNDNPRGGFTFAGQLNGKLRLAGWAFDFNALSTPSTVLVTIDGRTSSTVANLASPTPPALYAGIGSNHGFDRSYALSEGTHQVCVRVRNVGLGYDLSLPCRTITLNFTPTATLTALTASATGAVVSGWATDPDTTAAIPVTITVDGRSAARLTANGAGGAHSGHNFTAALPLTSGRHTVCAIGLNVLYGTHNSPPACQVITLALGPIGRLDGVSRVAGSSGIQVRGWALDPDTTGPIAVAVTVDGVAQPNLRAAMPRTDVAQSYPAYGPSHGFQAVIATTEGEHTVCLTAKNVGGGSDTPLGCRLIIAVHPVAPSAPRDVAALAGYGGATVQWTPPASDGGAPWSGYTVVASPGGVQVQVGSSTTSTTVLGLRPSTAYTFTVTATNVAGTSAAATSARVTTQASPPPQTTPAPVSTSRYIRNIRGSSATEQAIMRAEGKADALANPSGHGYLILLDIGGQDQIDGGVVLSATTRFVGYTDLVRDLQAYVDGYASGQRLSAPVTIAIGTNNDMDVSAASGRAWAQQVINPVLSYARRHPGITIAGANDIEPGFSATYSQTQAWLGGYLGATSAPFIFNGSADGCSWTSADSGCNNGWTMSGLYHLAAGAAPVRMLNLPQIYNDAMAGQWKYISLTGVGRRLPRINFAGTLTEWTACDQTNDCGSLTGNNAWRQMWTNLQSDARLRVGSLPYSTDLRIDA